MAEVDLRACSLATCTLPFGCGWCGKPLRRRQSRWCSRLCSREFEVNHLWTMARAEAVRRAGRRCVVCGGKSDLEVNHIVPLAVVRPGAADPYGASCAHHQDGLEVVCHTHHLERTAEQRAAGAFRR